MQKKKKTFAQTDTHFHTQDSPATVCEHRALSTSSPSPGNNLKIKCNEKNSPLVARETEWGI